MVNRCFGNVTEASTTRRVGEALVRGESLLTVRTHRFQSRLLNALASLLLSLSHPDGPYHPSRAFLLRSRSERRPCLLEP